MRGRAPSPSQFPSSSPVFPRPSTIWAAPAQDVHNGPLISTCAKSASGAKSKEEILLKRVPWLIKVSAEVCPLCEGTGWKTAPSPARSTDSQSNGPSTPQDRRVTRCDCQIRARTQSLLAAARIPRRYEHCELANYDFDGPRRALASARMAACRFVEEDPPAAPGL